jgi:dephospho-CoA kinase
MFECGFDKKCDLTISVTAKRELRILRITERDCISVEAAERRIDAMRSDEFLRENTDLTFDNSGSLTDLCEFVDSVTRKYGLCR